MSQEMKTFEPIDGTIACRVADILVHMSQYIDTFNYNTMTLKEFLTSVQVLPNPGSKAEYKIIETYQDGTVSTFDGLNPLSDFLKQYL